MKPRQTRPDPTPDDLGYGYSQMSRSDKIWLWWAVAVMAALIVGIVIVELVR